MLQLGERGLESPRQLVQRAQEGRVERPLVSRERLDVPAHQPPQERFGPDQQNAAELPPPARPLEIVPLGRNCPPPVELATRRDPCKVDAGFRPFGFFDCRTHVVA
jgi:hypothetical protein